ncbi:MAG: pyruvate, phosphate dikinase [Calditrichaeota bacterium]|nr:MAG: pyruvate, phosphate dikinase [Calditrichota bacterium]
MSKYVYSFGGGSADGRADMKNLLGGKGANLAEMANLDIPVPAGFTITTEVCTLYYENNQNYPAELEGQVKEGLGGIEKVMGAGFSDDQNPLLLSVRSGARVSMPGMMDTILNLGLNDTTVKGLAAKTNNERFAWDCYRRFVQMYGDVVLDLKPKSKDDVDPFEEILDNKKEARGIKYDTELTADDLKDLVSEFKAAILEQTGHEFPEDPMVQLWGAITAVFGSWNNERAIVYRKLNGFPDAWGTAVNVQSMVYGNMGDDCATGVGFTRDPATGENTPYGEYLVNAQGEDVVAGTRTPEPFENMSKFSQESYDELTNFATKLERHYKDMQDYEFTIQNGHLWMLQTRAGKRTGFAAVKIAVDMVEEGLITKEEALMRVEPNMLNQLLRPIFDADEKAKNIQDKGLFAKGLNAGPGAATGRIVFNAPDAVEWKAKGEDVVLVRIETSPEDIQGMHAAEGILTARGGMTSHAALVGRQMGRVCVVGCESLQIDYKKRQVNAGGKVLKEGDWISLDGSTGEVMEGHVTTKPSEVLQVLLEKSMKPEDSDTYHTYAKLMEWADEVRKLNVRTNADQPDQAATAIAFGAEGIGLTRTEHMFFEGDRIDSVREMILSDDLVGRKKALAKLQPMQKDDFAGIFKAMDGKPVTIRLLDPPLHEFLPQSDKEIDALAKDMGVPVEKLHTKIEQLHELNPMLGHRGCRLGLVYPEITEMQTTAILEAACEVKKAGVDVLPEIMVPLVGHVTELRNQEKVIRKVAADVFAAQGIEVDYMVGTMIELPRAALTADEIAEVAEFFSFGTNDLTQTTLGISRDDAGKFLPIYVDQDIVEADPFEKLDQVGVGQLVEMGVQKGRSTRDGMKVGICGEHGGEPSSVKFCHRAGMNYVSCSPFRVPIARLAAAQAVLEEK